MRDCKRIGMMLAVALAALLSAGEVRAELVTVWDSGAGQYRNYEVTRSGEQVTVFDYDRGSYITGQQRADGSATYYDHSRGSFYEGRPTGPGSYSGYDYETGTFQDYEVTPGGGVRSFDYGTGTRGFTEP